MPDIDPANLSTNGAAAAATPNGTESTPKGTDADAPNAPTVGPGNAQQNAGAAALGGSVESNNGESKEAGKETAAAVGTTSADIIKDDNPKVSSGENQPPPPAPRNEVEGAGKHENTSSDHPTVKDDAEKQGAKPNEAEGTSPNSNTTVHPDGGKQEDKPKEAPKDPTTNPATNATTTPVPTAPVPTTTVLSFSAILDQTLEKFVSDRWPAALNHHQGTIQGWIGTAVAVTEGNLTKFRESTAETFKGVHNKFDPLIATLETTVGTHTTQINTLQQQTSKIAELKTTVDGHSTDIKKLNELNGKVSALQTTSRTQGEDIKKLKDLKIESRLKDVETKTDKIAGLKKTSDDHGKDIKSLTDIKSDSRLKALEKKVGGLPPLKTKEGDLESRVAALEKDAAKPRDPEPKSDGLSAAEIKAKFEKLTSDIADLTRLVEELKKGQTPAPTPPKPVPVKAVEMEFKGVNSSYFSNADNYKKIFYILWDAGMRLTWDEFLDKNAATRSLFENNAPVQGNSKETNIMIPPEMFEAVGKKAYDPDSGKKKYEASRKEQERRASGLRSQGSVQADQN